MNPISPQQISTKVYSFDTLHDDNISSIFSHFCDAKTLTRVMRVCKRWRKIILERPFLRLSVVVGFCRNMTFNIHVNLFLSNEVKRYQNWVNQKGEGARCNLLDSELSACETAANPSSKSEEFIKFLLFDNPSNECIDEAEKIIASMQNPGAKAAAQLHLTRAYIQKENLQLAITTFECAKQTLGKKIPEERVVEFSETRKQLFELQLQKNDFVGAKKNAKEHKDNVDFQKLIIKQLELKNFSEAFDMIMESSEVKVSFFSTETDVMLEKLFQAQLAYKDYEGIRKEIDFLKNPYDKMLGWLALDEFVHAEKMALSITDVELRDQALMKIARKHAEKGDVKSTEKIVLEIREGGGYLIPMAQAKSGQIKKAVESASQLDFMDAKVAFEFIISLLIEKRKFKPAIKYAHTCGVVVGWVFLQRILQIYLKEKKFLEIEKCLDNKYITDNESLSCLSKALVASGNIAGAQTAAKKIKKDYCRADALVEIGNKQIDEDLLADAEELLAKINFSTVEKLNFSTRLVYAYARKRHYTKAMQIIIKHLDKGFKASTFRIYEGLAKIQFENGDVSMAKQTMIHLQTALGVTPTLKLQLLDHYSSIIYQKESKLKVPVLPKAKKTEAEIHMTENKNDKCVIS